MKPFLLTVSWFITGALVYFSWQLRSENLAVSEELGNLQGASEQYQQQVEINAQQREEFEGQIQQLQSNLLGAQAQMRNLSESLQEAREMMEPARALQQAAQSDEDDPDPVDDPEPAPPPSPDNNPSRRNL